MIKKHKIEVLINEGNHAKIRTIARDFVDYLYSEGLDVESASLTEYAGMDSEVVEVLDTDKKNPLKRRGDADLSLQS